MASRSKPSRPSTELAVALIKARFILQKVAKLSLSPGMGDFANGGVEIATAALEKHAPKLLAEFDHAQVARRSK